MVCWRGAVLLTLFFLYILVIGENQIIELGIPFSVVVRFLAATAVFGHETSVFGRDG